MIKNKKKKELILKGYLVEYDKYNRIKLMLLEKSDFTKFKNHNIATLNFTKDFITNKSAFYKQKNPNSYCPIVDEKYFYIKCKKNQKCEVNINQISLTDNELTINNLTRSNNINDQKYSNIEEDSRNTNTPNKKILIDINKVLQNYVECIVEINDYNFEIKGEHKEGYNIKLKKIKVL